MDEAEVKPKKLVIIGDGACGKTCFLHRFVNQEFSEGYIPTIFENLEHVYEFEGSQKILRIWDTAGQEDYERLRPLAYPNTDVCFIAFSVVNRDSFDNVETNWIKEFRQYMPKAQIILIGTKSDLAARPDLKNHDGSVVEPVTKEEGDKMANRIKAYGYYETSAKTGDGVKAAFEAAITAANIKPRQDNNSWLSCFPCMSKTGAESS